MKRIPPGPCIEIGVGKGSLTIMEHNPATLFLDLFPRLLPRQHGVVADAQRLPFRDATISGIWCQAVLMHVTLPTFLNETKRCLRHGGIVGVIEPLSGHPLVQCYRRFASARSSCPHYPSFADFLRARENFTRSQVVPYFLFSPLVLPLLGRNHPFVDRLQNIDARLLNRFPGLSRFAWYTAAVYQV